PPLDVAPRRAQEELDLGRLVAPQAAEELGDVARVVLGEAQVALSGPAVVAADHQRQRRRRGGGRWWRGGAERQHRYGETLNPGAQGWVHSMLPAVNTQLGRRGKPEAMKRQDAGRKLRALSKIPPCRRGGRGGRVSALALDPGQDLPDRRQIVVDGPGAGVVAAGIRRAVARLAVALVVRRGQAHGLHRRDQEAV